MRDADAHPPALNSGAAAIKARIGKSQELLAADQQQVNDLTAKLAQAKDAQKDAVQDELDLAQSQLDLDKDELDEANQDLVDAGGNPQQQIAAMVQEHDAQTKAHADAPVLLQAAGHGAPGIAGKISRLAAIAAETAGDLDEARTNSAAESPSAGLRHTRLAATLEAAKGGIVELAHHTKAAKEAGNSAAGAECPAHARRCGVAR